MKTLLLDANSIMLLTRAGWIPESDGETSVATTAIAAYELGNAVWKELHLFKRVTEEESRILFTVFHETMLRLKVETQLKLAERLEVLSNADRFGMSYYDSSYLTAAIQLDATLVTEDKRLGATAEECGLLTCSAGELVKTLNN